MKRIIENIVSKLNTENSKKVFQEIGLLEYEMEYNLDSLLILNYKLKLMNGSSKEFYLSELFGEKNLTKVKIVFDELEKYDTIWIA